MRSHPPSRTRRALLATATVVGGALLLSGCASDTVKRGFLPGYSDGEVTNQTARITSLWLGAWEAALIVGVITWGLMLWCITVYRKRKDDHRLPVQTRYHMPLEIMYTAVPVMLVLVLFFYTDRDVTAIQDRSETPDMTVEVVGKQWSWDFNYLDDDVYETGQQEGDPGDNLTKDKELDGVPGTSTALPTLYLPAGERVEFKLESRDVIHSFWIPAFLYKQDVVPGRHTNGFQVVPEREGVYAGKCAELCGEFHSGMLFNVAVVSPQEYEQHMQDLRDKGQTGRIPVEGFSRAQSAPDDSSTEEAES
ncbi:cytochrome c oxidase subunit II [Cellulomonas sp. PhB143]|uniref:aa3-type cytochrome oxidase subunit II n=1 Tax=Cellulomonas sp. PhB143 TaxID=2485186 RepID=UPI000F463083|nr:cytochrome c oxidase subunit II [Cellulomonas sp. PhB143]ROS73024.1 cytochrome c oxidase subunit 2 [Cellulomonas sp. PhB143]